MLTLEINDQHLEQQIDQLLHQDFAGDTRKMLEMLIQYYTLRQQRAQYSGVIKWNQDGLEYQKALRDEWS